MVTRSYCPQCQRPVTSCICQFTVKLNNQVTVVVLQHPTETKQSKGTAALLALSLNRYQAIIGENFSEHQQVKEIIAKYGAHCYLLYPEPLAQNVELLSAELAQQHVDLADCCIILLDATWKKSYRMFQLSKNLQALPKITLPEALPGQYLIRKTRKAGALSTLEACVYALQRLEHNKPKYQPLLASFKQFNLFQLTFVKNANAQIQTLESD